MEAARRRPALDVLEALALFAVLLAFWILLSGRLEAKDLLFGAASAALVTGLTHERLVRKGRGERELGPSLRRLSPLASLRYGLWLLVQIVQANLQVAWLVLQPRLPVAPKLLSFRAGFEGPLPQVVLAHSITLTPGTVTIDLEDGRYLVHALVPRSADALLSGRMQRGVASAFRLEVDEEHALEWVESVRETELGGGTGR